ncbi:HAMP domain-containing sensor histidine kinase [Gorillibacterium sp. sgz500922]|uniref:HAMP domain-containing sensor histidine kinase n=1 Tax=Gorillibacterium sp. sgz500922 TaxID=3446694 RepID=UPI003F67270E
MLLFRSVVGKLWMTIIALVAVVLIILGLFLFRYIDTSFPDQSGSLLNTAEKLADLYREHGGDPAFAESAGEILSAEDAGVAVLELSKPMGESLLAFGGSSVPADQVFSKGEQQAIRSGDRIKASYRPPGEEGAGYLLVTVPAMVQDGDTLTHSLVLYQSKKSIEDLQSYVKRIFVYVCIVGFLLTTSFGFFLITRINRPLIELQKAAENIRTGDYKRRVVIHSRDEIGELGTTFNLMARQLDSTIRDLQLQKDNLASVLRSMADAVISFDTDGRIIFLNPNGEKLLADWSRYQSDEPEEEEAFEEPENVIPGPLRPLFQSATEGTKEIAARLHVEKEVWSAVMAPLYSGETVRGAVVVMRDVTEEYRAEKMKTDFVANVSHELRTPLSMLQGYSEALVDDIPGTPEERKELAQVIYDESLRMGRLVRDLLDLSRLETGHMEMHFREIGAHQLLARMQRKFAALCRDKGIELALAFTPNAEIQIRGDEDRLEQVLTNLIDNAIRHTPSGAAIRLRSYPALLKGEPALTLEVEDEGEGIPADDLPYVFERFYKADKARKRGSTGGTGLGLAIARNIAELHKGVIEVRSTLGKGTTFTLIVPLK